MAIRRLYYDPNVHGSGTGTYQNLNVGNAWDWQLIDLRSSSLYVFAAFDPHPGLAVCFGTVTDGAIFGCWDTGALQTVGVRELPAAPSGPAADWFMPTHSEPWVAYTSNPLTAGLAEVIAVYHRK